MNVEPFNALTSGCSLATLMSPHYSAGAFDSDLVFQSPPDAGAHPYTTPKYDNNASSDFRAAIPDETSSTGTDYPFSLLELFCSFLAELSGKWKETWQTYYEYWKRIETLRNYAALEGLTVNHFSERDFWSFVASVPSVREGELVLLDNGNLRAIWDEEDGSHLGLQFLGDGMLQFVIFRRKKGSSHISRVAGRDTFEGIKEQVRIFELEAFLNA